MHGRVAVGTASKANGPDPPIAPPSFVHPPPIKNLCNSVLIDLAKAERRWTEKKLHLSQVAVIIEIVHLPQHKQTVEQPLVSSSRLRD